MIVCGHCNNKHKTAGRVRACAAKAGISPDSYGDIPVEPSKKQLDYAHALVRQRLPLSEYRDHSEDNVHELINEMDRMTVRDFISRMLKRPEKF